VEVPAGWENCIMWMGDSIPVGPSNVWEHNIERDLQILGYDNVDSIPMSLDRNQQRLSLKR